MTAGLLAACKHPRVACARHSLCVPGGAPGLCCQVAAAFVGGTLLHCAYPLQERRERHLHARIGARLWIVLSHADQPLFPCTSSCCLQERRERRFRFKKGKGKKAADEEEEEVRTGCCVVGVVQLAAAGRKKGEGKTAAEGEEEGVRLCIRETSAGLDNAGFVLAFLPVCVGMASA